MKSIGGNPATTKTMKMASLNSSVFISFTILTVSLALCSASRTFSYYGAAIEGDDHHQVSLDHKVRLPPRNDEVEADKFGFKVRDGDDVEATKMSNMDHKVSAFIAKDETYEPEEKPRKRGEYDDVEAAKMSNVGHQVSAFDSYDPEEKQKPGKYDVDAAQMNNMDHGDRNMITGHGRVRPISGDRMAHYQFKPTTRVRPTSDYKHRNHGDMMAHYRVKPIKGSSNDGDMMAHYQVKPIKGSSNDGDVNPEKGN